MFTLIVETACLWSIHTGCNWDLNMDREEWVGTRISGPESVSCGLF